MDARADDGRIQYWLTCKLAVDDGFTLQRSVQRSIRGTMRNAHDWKVGWILLALLLYTVSPLATCARKVRYRDRCNKTVEIKDDVTSPPVTVANRGKPLLCSYKFRLSIRQTDWIISVRFYRLKVGHLVNTSTCADGFVQIIDGTDTSRVSNRKAPGYFCGEIDRHQTYISETSFVKITFFAQSFTEDTYFAFDSLVEQQFELYARYGQNPILYPDRRGKLVAGTFCDRIFEDCRLGTCYIQSPGYPGIYPRNVRCRYFVQTQTVYINPYLENEMLSIDGQHCADMIVCPLRPVTTNCPGDYLRIHDGWSETSPVIGTFCGTGRFPYAITGTGTQLLVVFVSTPAGPMLNTGFHFNVGPNPKWVGPGAAKMANSSCSWVFYSNQSASEEDNRLHSLATWYTPNTQCDFLIRANSNEIIRIFFKSFRVQRPKHAISTSWGDCAESLSIYDSDKSDEKTVLAIFCDTWGSLVDSDRYFVSSGPVMLVQFKSAIGSYSGSSLDYWIQFEFYNAFHYGQPVANTVCDETFESSTSTSGYFSSPLNYLVFKRKDALRCLYAFRANLLPFERVFLTFSSLQFGYSDQSCDSCLTDQVDKIVIQESSHFSTGLVCLCNTSLLNEAKPGLTFISNGPNMDVRLYYQSERIESNYFHNKINVFQGTYEFFHGPKCGPALVEIKNQGELIYPYPEEDAPDEEGQLYSTSASSWRTRCIWSVPVTPHMDIYLVFTHLTMPINCSSDRIEIRLPVSGFHYAEESILLICGGDSNVELPVINSTSMPANKFLVELRTSGEETRFNLVITQVVHEKESQSFLKLGMASCPFLCRGSNVCISHDLVCNGVRNCPRTEHEVEHDYFTSLDESLSLCDRGIFSLNWMGLAIGGGVGFFLTLCLMFVVRKCRRKRTHGSY